ncbi:MAG TPA: MgtC/SapB family protein, partial [Pseudorhizobium sp.]|nr:MgtC/SapB family protein [Pseudorhizobium sp.]
PSSTERARSDLLFASGFDPLGPGKQPSPQGVNFGRRSGVNFEGRLTATGAIGTAVGLGAYDIAVVISLVTFLTLRTMTPLKRVDDRDVGSSTD